MTTTNPPAAHARSYRVGNLDLNRIGYGAMRLAGPGVLARRTSAPPRPRRRGPWWNRASTTSTRPTPTGRTAPTRSSRETLLPRAGARQPPPARARRARRGQPPDPRRDRRPRDGHGHAHAPVRGTR